MLRLRRSTSLCSLVLVVSLAQVSLSRAAFLTTNNATTFQNFVTSNNINQFTQTYNGVPDYQNRRLGPVVNSSTAAPTPFAQGVTYSTTNGTDLYLFGPNTNTLAANGANNTNTVLSPLNLNVGIRIMFDQPQRAVSLYLLSVFSSTTVVSAFSTSGAFLGNIGTLGANSGTGTFVGLYATTAADSIGSLVVNQPLAGQGQASDYVNIDRMTFSAFSVPEPASLVMVATALLGGAGLMHRSRRKAS